MYVCHLAIIYSLTFQLLIVSFAVPSGRGMLGQHLGKCDGGGLLIGHCTGQFSVQPLVEFNDTRQEVSRDSEARILDHKPGKRIDVIGFGVTEVHLGENAVSQCLFSGHPRVVDIKLPARARESGCGRSAWVSIPTDNVSTSELGKR